MERGSVVISEDSPKAKAAYSVISFQATALPAEYRNVIIARWLRSLRTLNDFFKLIDKEIYFPVYEKYVKLLLSRPTCEIKLAVLTENKDVVFGWSLIENKDTLHYMHVQEDFRRQGISNFLVPKDTKYCSHVTKHWFKIWHKKYPNIKFNPFV